MAVAWALVVAAGPAVLSAQSGHSLEGEAPAYLSFLIDNAGRLRIALHTGDEVQELVPWTRSDAVAVLDKPATSPAENVLEVDVRGEETSFYIGGDAVADFRSDELALNGVIGGPGPDAARTSGRCLHAARSGHTLP